MSTSTDGGQTWSQPVSPQGNPKGLAGQPVVEPNGAVIVSFETITGKEAAFESTDGGTTWSQATTIASIAFHSVAGSLRTSPLPAAEIDGAGKVYVAWEDCRFRVKCSSNDIAFSKSSDGINWSPVTRVPIDSVTSGVDHFIPGLAVDKATSGSGAHLALTYYFFFRMRRVLEAANSTPVTSPLLTAEPTGEPRRNSRARRCCRTSQGRMVGDYISTSFNASGLATTVFAVGRTPRGKSVQRVDVRPKFAVTGGVAVVGDTGRKQRRRAVNPRHRDGLPVAVDQAIARIEPTRHALKLLRREQLLSAPQLSRRYGRIDPNGRALSRPGRQAADKRFGGECFAE